MEDNNESTDISENTIVTDDFSEDAVSTNDVNEKSINDNVVDGTITTQSIASMAIVPGKIRAESADAEFVDLDIAHFSMQFDDTQKQQITDAAKVFSRDYDWITGTEAGHNGTLVAVLRVAAVKNGYTFHMYKSNWIAAKKTLIEKGSYEKGGETVVDNDVTVGKGSDSNICWVQFFHKALGRVVTLLCSHYPTKGRPDSNPEYSVNLKHNKKLAHAIGDMTEEEGAGKALVFYGGDQNIVDRVADTFFGEPLTTIWDELGQHENTGHGNIDVIASFDKDRQVEGRYVRALDDEELFMFADHFPIEAGYRVRALI